MMSDAVRCLRYSEAVMYNNICDVYFLFLEL